MKRPCLICKYGYIHIRFAYFTYNKCHLLNGIFRVFIDADKKKYLEYVKFIIGDEVEGLY